MADISRTDVLPPPVSTDIFALSDSFYTLNKLVNIAASSAKIRKITVNLPDSTPRINLRPQIHLWIQAKKSSFKTAILHEAQKYYGGDYEYMFTYASLVGSTDSDTGRDTTSAAWNVRNSILFIDEFTVAHKNDLPRALLSLLSDGEHSRIIKSKKFRRYLKDNDLFFRVKDGSIKIKTRFVAMFATMYSLEHYSRYTVYDALMDRCIVIPYKVTDEMRRKVARGTPVFQYKPYDVKPEVIISAEDYQYIYNFWDKNSPKFYANVDNYLDIRALDDMLRIFAVTQKHDDELYLHVLEYASNIEQIKEKVKQERELRIAGK